MRLRLMMRIVAPVLAVSLLLLVIGGAAAWYVLRLNAKVSHALGESLESVLASQELVLAIRDVHVQLLRFQSTQDPSFLGAARDARSGIEEAIQRAGERQLARQPADLLRRTRQSYRQFDDRLRKATAELPQRADLSVVTELRRGLNSRVLTPAQQLLEYHRQAAAEQSRQNKILASRIGLGLFLLGLCGSVAGLLAGYGIARGVSRSIEQLGGSVRAMVDTLNGISGPADVSGGIGLLELESAMRDLTDRAETVVKQLHETRQQAERSEQLAAIGQLAAGLAHELCNPLTSMKLLVQTAEERKSTLSGRDMEVLEEEIVRLQRLLQTFLDFARPPRLQKQTIDVCRLVEETVEVASPRGQQQGVAITFDRPAGRTTIEADVDQFRQVLLNLVLNAIDAQPRGGAVSIEVGSDNGCNHNEAVFRVADTGVGLPQELRERIFEPFVSTKETGVGLGLSICRRIVESHGGTIEAGDRPEGGAVFTVRLPGTRPTCPD